MGTDLFIFLINPSIAVLLSATFLLFWLNRREKLYLAGLSIGYAAGGLGFLLQLAGQSHGSAAIRLASGAAFLFAGFITAWSICRRLDRPTPLVVLVAALGGLAAFCWFLFIDPDLTWRIYSVNFAMGVISLMVAAEIYRVPGKTALDRALLVTTLVVGLNFFLRTVLVIRMTGPYESYDGFYHSLYWTTALYTHALLSLTLAFCLISAAAIDVFRDLRDESLTDPLSGLLNRRGFEERGAEMLERCRKAGFPVAMVLADLDHFKHVNDLHGHAAGDRVIADFARKLNAASGARGVCGRIGGEEFAVLLPLADLASARLLAEAVRSLFSSGAVDGLPAGTRVTASFGVAARSGNEELGPLIARADEALYRAKRHGRDSVRISYERAPEASQAAQPSVLLVS